MITKIRAVGVWVSDQDKAYDFFVNKLGFAVKSDVLLGDYRWLEVVPPGAETVLAVAKPYPGQSGANIGVFANIIFAVDDIEVTYEQLLAKGVNFIEKPTLQAWGSKQAIFGDPDGNTYLLVERD